MTNAIAVSDKIQGNIGGCETKISKIETNTHLGYSDFKTYATNSCTGQIETFPTWEISDGFVISGILILFVVVMIIAVGRD